MVTSDNYAELDTLDDVFLSLDAVSAKKADCRLLD
jgi:hypothetical protein